MINVIAASLCVCGAPTAFIHRVLRGLSVDCLSDGIILHARVIFPYIPPLTTSSSSSTLCVLTSYDSQKTEDWALKTSRIVRQKKNGTEGMTEMVDSRVIRDAIAAGQAEAAALSLRNQDGDNITAHTTHGGVLPSFEGFTDFELDLTCLSPPASPPESLYSDARSASASATPTASPRHSLSLQSSSPSHSQRAASRKSPSPRFSSVAAASGIVRGSWPLVRYVGRGTPIDRTRRIEWAAGATGSDEVGEDGVLFSSSHVRSTSLDSGAHHSERSVSPDWNLLNRRPSTLPARSRSRSFALAPSNPTPEIQIEGLGSDKAGEWAESFMQTVLSVSSPSEEEEAALAASTSSAASTSQPRHFTKENLTPLTEMADVPTMSPEEIRRLDTGLEMDLGIDAALDLGLGYRGGMNWFDLGMLPPSGRESPSMYSESSVQLHHGQQLQQHSTPRPSRPPSAMITPMDNRSVTSTKVLDPVDPPTVQQERKPSSQVWWRKVLKRLRKVHSLLGSHGH